MLKRTHNCGQLRLDDAGKKAALAGWVHSYRDHGNLVFIDLRDREGLTQLVFDPENQPEAHKLARTARCEWVIAAQGVVQPRTEGMKNPKLPTGEIEISVRQLQILNVAKTPPFEMDGAERTGEELRLTNRYIDLRRPEMQTKLQTRHKVTMAVRDYFDKMGFWEIETPMLAKSTPEGARDFLVPSRLVPNSFYALPQSPQLFKQLLMVAGVDRYMQIVRCFRDEDLRADRQPEFTQIDLEMSFVEPDDVMAAAERLVAALFADLLGVELTTPFPRLPHAEAMERYGSDKPDLRYGMELLDCRELGEIRFDFVKASLAEGGVLEGMVVPGGASMSRKQIDGVVDRARQLGLGGLLWGKVAADGWTGPASKGFGDDFKAAVGERRGAREGDLFMAATGAPAVVDTALDRLRRELADERGLIPPDTFHFCWIVDFPLLERDEDAERWVAKHHPFTAPLPEDLERLETDPGAVRARAYDLVCNGVELGGGSIRIHDPDLQDRMFRALGIDDEEAEARFGFLRRALSYGAPPHGGLAFGFDRLVAMMAGTDAIRDVIAFPKTTSASCLMTSAPSSVDPAQLADLHLAVTKP